MKRLLKNLSIRNKLMVVTMGATLAALAVVGVALGIRDVATTRARMVEDIQTHTAIVALNLTAAVTFGDQQDAAATLQSLKVASVQVAVAYDKQNKPLATFEAKPGMSASVPAVPLTEGVVFGKDSLDTTQPIIHEGERIGTVYVRMGLDELHTRNRQHMMTVVAATLGAGAVALLLVGRLRRLICDPVSALAAVVVKVSSEQDYSIRAERAGNDEVGQLTEGFNTMLAAVEARDAQLRSHREHLEVEVAARTDELATKAKELQTLNSQLVLEKDRAEQSSRSKSAFLANMSHEIRTPMTAILGYSDLMLTPSQTMSDRIDSLQVIRRNARHLMALINDILDISKIEAERMLVEKLPCDLPQVVVDVASMLRARAVEKSLSLRVDFQDPIPKTIYSDALRLKQVLMNLVGNAIKFTEHGEICLRVTVVDVPATEPHKLATSHVRFEIQDSGIGMTGSQISRLFQPFVQADESMTRKYGGTGLGLVISQRLTKLLGGDIVVTSEPGRGSVFTVTIDGGDLSGVQRLHGLTESVLQPEAKVDADEVRVDGRILLAEDGPDNRHLISLHLTLGGATVATAENGRIAIEMVAAQSYDLILMDMQMPELDGYGAASELRRRGCTLPIIALTAHAMTGDREKCLAAGCTDYLTKPIDPELLLRTVQSYLMRAKKNEVAAPKPTAVATEPLSQPATEKPEPTAAPCEVVRPQLVLPKSAVAAQAMKQAVEQFIGRLPQRVDELARLVDEELLVDLQRTVHQLKGAGTSYGFPHVTSLAAAAETKLKQAAPIEEVRAGVEELIDLIRRVEGYAVGRETYVTQ